MPFNWQLMLIDGFSYFSVSLPLIVVFTILALYVIFSGCWVCSGYFDYILLGLWATMMPRCYSNLLIVSEMFLIYGGVILFMDYVIVGCMGKHFLMKLWGLCVGKFYTV